RQTPSRRSSRWTFRPSRSNRAPTRTRPTPRASPYRSDRAWRGCAPPRRTPSPATEPRPPLSPRGRSRRRGADREGARRCSAAAPRRLALSAGPVLVLLGSARAGWPPPRDDTGFDYADPTNWPSDGNYSDQTDFWSFVPDKIIGQVDERTKRLGTGSHYDRAF